MAVACCKLYISEARNVQTLQALEKACVSYSKDLLINVFKDCHYNRVCFTLASSLSSSLLPKTVMEVVRTALQTIDLQSQSGNHPRLGVVDHIWWLPLGTASLQQVASLAQSLAKDIATTFQVPTYLYGAAHSENRSLDSIRRSMRYFNSNSEGQWVGLTSDKLALAPDYGPSKISASAGLVVVGASPWVVTYNVPINCSNIAIGRWIARRVRGRGGGLPGVQALGLSHGDKGMEICCRILDPQNIGPERVQLEVERLAQQMCVGAERGYLTDYLEHQVLEIASRRLKNNPNLQ
eukprot:TRINITY_DN1963_c0_g1_i4.p1 TRINITY_DN1963_c0_g1~~TRINITY_DN1963_c0_g1_i4.p1  ORF type:complete len:318 (-),score=43.80 TRINITY_DN1963_c0_g1_i4:125-1006(-)